MIIVKSSRARMQEYVSTGLMVTLVCVHQALREGNVKTVSAFYYTMLLLQPPLRLLWEVVPLLVLSLSCIVVWFWR